MVGHMRGGRFVRVSPDDVLRHDDHLVQLSKRYRGRVGVVELVATNSKRVLCNTGVRNGFGESDNRKNSLPSNKFQVTT